MAFIPARGGSKGIVNKNLANLGGIPLIAHSIVAARECPLIDRIVVSTDSPVITETAKKWGAEVPFLRPTAIAGDRSTIREAITYTINQLHHLEGYNPQAFIILLPTHPFRSPSLMEELTSRLLAGYRVVRSVRCLSGEGLIGHFWINQRNRLVALKRSYPLPTYYCRSYGLYTGILRLADPPQNFYLYRLEKPEELIDIDTPEDLQRANMMLQEGEVEIGG